MENFVLAVNVLTVIIDIVIIVMILRGWRK